MAGSTEARREFKGEEMMDAGKIRAGLQELAAGFAQNEHIETVALAGSAVGEMADHHSDYDLYIYSRDAVDIDFRAKLLTLQTYVTVCNPGFRKGGLASQQRKCL
jgi:hypothetical protein